jgi:alcohol dehydrogenase
MKALVYHGPGLRGWDTVDDPTIVDSNDAVVRIDTSTICGTDLHILKGDVPETTRGPCSVMRPSGPCRKSDPR